MRAVKWFQVCATLVLLSGTATAALAQAPDADTREAVIADAQADKARSCKPTFPAQGERLVTACREHSPAIRRRGGGPISKTLIAAAAFALGAAYVHHRQRLQLHRLPRQLQHPGHTSAPKRSSCLLSCFTARGKLSVMGGWREATQVGFFGTGTSTSLDDRTNYGLQQPVRIGSAHAQARRGAT